MKSDLLQNLINWSAIVPMSRNAGGHDDQMQGLFKGATVLAHWNEGDYQGYVATAVRLEDGRYCWYQDSYGSCSGCDSWEDATDEDVRKLCIGLACDADVFDSMDALLADMETDDPRGWAKEAGHQLARLLRASNAPDQPAGASPARAASPC